MDFKLFGQTILVVTKKLKLLLASQLGKRVVPTSQLWTGCLTRVIGEDPELLELTGSEPLSLEEETGNVGCRKTCAQGEFAMIRDKKTYIYIYIYIYCVLCFFGIFEVVYIL